MKKILIIALPLAFYLSCANNRIQKAIEDEKAAAVATASAIPQQSVTVQFAAKIGNQFFDCAAAVYTGIGLGSSNIYPQDFRFFVHDVRLVRSSGIEVPITLTQDGSYQYQNVVLLDFENAAPGSRCESNDGDTSVNTAIRGTIPASESLTFTKIRFKVGMPENLNHLDGAGPPPLNVTKMFWAWATGYKHVLLEFYIPDFGSGNNGTFFTHLGDNGNCDGDPGNGIPYTCEHNNLPSIELSFTYGQTVVADAKKLYENTDFRIPNQGTQIGCHSGTTDEDCGALFSNWGLPFYYAGSSSARGLTPDTTYPAGTQKFFRVE